MKWYPCTHSHRIPSLKQKSKGGDITIRFLSVVTPPRDVVGNGKTREAEKVGKFYQNRHFLERLYLYTKHSILSPNEPFMRWCCIPYLNLRLWCLIITWLMRRIEWKSAGRDKAGDNSPTSEKIISKLPLENFCILVCLREHYQDQEGQPFSTIYYLIFQVSDNAGQIFRVAHNSLHLLWILLCEIFQNDWILRKKKIQAFKWILICLLRNVSNLPKVRNVGRWKFSE